MNSRELGIIRKALGHGFNFSPSDELTNYCVFCNNSENNGHTGTCVIFKAIKILESEQRKVRKIVRLDEVGEVVTKIYKSRLEKIRETL